MAAAIYGRITIPTYLLFQTIRLGYAARLYITTAFGVTVGCEGGNWPVVRKLLQHELFDLCTRNNTPLLNACKSGDLLVVQEPLP